MDESIFQQVVKNRRPDSVVILTVRDRGPVRGRLAYFFNGYAHLDSIQKQNLTDPDEGVFPIVDILAVEA